jgi:hypothetical protein
MLQDPRVLALIKCAGRLGLGCLIVMAAVFPVRAQGNQIESVSVASENQDTVVFDVVYTYSGDHGRDVFMSVVMTDNGDRSPHYGYRPGRVEPGRHRTRVTLSASGSAPGVFSTNQIEASMYVGGQDRFLNRTFNFLKTWSRTGAALTPALLVVQAVRPALQPPAAAGEAAQGGGATIRSILPNGRVELRYPDGTIRQRYQGGETIITPDGQHQTFMYSHAQPPTPPIAPPDATHDAWLSYENTRLLDIIRELVGGDEPSVQNYLSREDGGWSSYQQIESRTQAIGYPIRP